MALPTFVALQGESGCGKNYLADKYFRQAGFLPVAFATEGKIRLVEDGLATWTEVFVTKPPHVRSLMQEYFTRWRESTPGETYWSDRLYNRCRLLTEQWGPQFSRFVITDLRFATELAYVQDRGGRVYHVHAPLRVAENGLTAEQRAHRSEAELRGKTYLMDGVLENDPEHAPSLGGQVYALLKAHQLLPAMGASFQLGVPPTLVYPPGVRRTS